MGVSSADSASGGALVENGRNWESFHTDLVLLWVESEGLKYQEVMDRLCRLFGEQLRVPRKTLDNKLLWRRRKLHGDGKKPVKRRIENPEGLSDEGMLGWFRSLMYQEVYVAKTRGDSAGLRKSIETTLKVLKHKRDVGVNSEDEDSKAMEVLLSVVRRDAEGESPQAGLN